MWFIVQVLANSAAFFVADRFVNGFNFQGDVVSLFIAGLVLTVINFFIKPILKIISMPLMVVSFGLFSIIINIGLLWFLTLLIDDLTITGLAAYFWSVLIVSAANMIFGVIKKKR